MQFGDVIDVHDRGAADSQELVWVQLLMQRCHSGPDPIRSSRCMEPHEIAFCSDPVDRLDREKECPVSFSDEQPLQRFPIAVGPGFILHGLRGPDFFPIQLVVKVHSFKFRAGPLSSTVGFGSQPAALAPWGRIPDVRINRWSGRPKGYGSRVVRDRRTQQDSQPIAWGGKAGPHPAGCGRSQRSRCPPRAIVSHIHG